MSKLPLFQPNKRRPLSISIRARRKEDQENDKISSVSSSHPGAKRSRTKISMKIYHSSLFFEEQTVNSTKWKSKDNPENSFHPNYHSRKTRKNEPLSENTAVLFPASRSGNDFFPAFFGSRSGAFKKLCTGHSRWFMIFITISHVFIQRRQNRRIEDLLEIPLGQSGTFNIAFRVDIFTEISSLGVCDRVLVIASQFH